MDDDFIHRVEFAHARGEFAQRNELGSGNAGDIPLVGFAHIEQNKLIIAVDTGLELFHCDLRHRQLRFLFSARLRNAAEGLVVDEVCDRWIFRAHGTARILADFKLAEFHLQRVKVHEAADEWFANTHDQFDGLNRLHDADHSWQNAQHATLGAAWHHAWRWRLWVEATVARASQVRGKNRALSVEAEDRAVDVWLLEKNTDVVAQIARGKIIRAIDHDIIRLHDLAGILRLKEGVVEIHLNIRIDFFDAVAGAVELLAADIFRSVQNLALQVREVHDVEIDKAHGANACGGQVKSDWRAQSACADAEHLCGLEALLALHGYFRHDEMPRVASHFIVAEVDFFHTGRIKNTFHV